jgi:hypothetical protein
MKHRLVHTLQKYLLNPPIKLALRLDCPCRICVAGNKRAENGEATTHACRRLTYWKPVLASGKAPRWFLAERRFRLSILVAQRAAVQCSSSSSGCMVPATLSQTAPFALYTLRITDLNVWGLPSSS